MFQNWGSFLSAQRTGRVAALHINDLTMVCRHGILALNVPLKNTFAPSCTHSHMQELLFPMNTSLPTLSSLCAQQDEAETCESGSLGHLDKRQ